MVHDTAGDGARTRGAATLLALRILDRFGSGAIGTIVRTPGSGEAILETAIGEPFGATFRDWTVTLHEELYPSAGLTRGFDFFDVAGFVDEVLGGAELVNALGRIPLSTEPGVRGGRTIPMRRGGAAYVLVTATEGLLGVDLAWTAPGAARLQVTVVRIR